MRKAAPATAAAAVACVLLFARAGTAVPPRMFMGAGETAPPNGHVDSGEALLHSIDAPGVAVAYHMPLASLGAALLFDHASRRAFAAARAALLAASLVLALALGTLLGPPLGGLLACGYLLARPEVLYTETVYSHFAHALLVLLAAGLLCWRARRPSLARTAALGGALAGCILFRSALAFFPPILALAERGRKRSWAELAALLLLPYIVLLPWISLTWKLTGRIVPFEDGEAAFPLIAGALGGIHTWDGGGHALILLGRADPRMPVILWAATQIAAHPMRYAVAVAARLGWAFGLHPVLCALALTALWLGRRRPEHRALALFCGYYTGIHCLLSVEEGYFVPLWPLFAALAGSLAARPLGTRPARERSAAGRMAVGALLVGLACVVAAAGWASSVVLRYSRRPPADALRELPDEPWLLERRGRAELVEGRFEEAAADFTRAAGRPYDNIASLDAAWAEALAGRPQRLLSLDSIAPVEDLTSRLLARRAFVLAERGQRDEARSQLESALLTYPGGEADADAMLDRLNEWLPGVPPRRRAALCRALNGQHAARCLANAAREEAELRRQAAERRPAPAPDDRARALLRQKAGDLKAARRLLARFLAAHPRDAGAWKDAGVAAYLAGDRAAAIRSLERAVALDPASKQARQSLAAARAMR